MNLVPVILGITSAVCFGSSDLLSRGASRVVGPYAVAVGQLLIGTIIMAVLTPIFAPRLALTAYSVLVMTTAALLNFASIVFLYIALRRGAVSIVAPVVYSYPAVTLVFSIFLLGVAITAVQIVALVSIMAGAILVSTRFSELRAKTIVVPGILPAVVAAILAGLAFVALGVAVRTSGPVVPAFFLRAVGAFSGFLLAPLVRQNVTITRYSFSPRIIAIGSLAAFAFLTFNTGVSLAPDSLPIVTALSGTSSAFDVSYAMIFIRERLEPNQMGGILLLMVGVFVLLYLSG